MDTFWEEIVTRLRDFFDVQTLTDRIAELVADLVVGLIVFAGFLMAWYIVHRLLRNTLQRAKLNETASSFIETLAKYAFLGIGAVYALNAAGINTAALLASLGIAGLTIGFAAKDALSNLISGLLIFIYQPFLIGDLIDVDDQYGRVDKITLRSTRVITVDGKMLAVPNTEIINKTVASYTKYPHLRLDIPVTIGLSENMDRVRQLLMDLVERDDDFMTDPRPRMSVTQLNDYNVAIELQAWLRDERTHVEKRFQLRERVYTTLTEAGIDMPLETIQLAAMDVKVHPNGT